jgi:16S rRNA (guanine527-N7)-methyltransferase
MEILLKYFTDLSPEQTESFGRLENLYLEWNTKINVISRKDMDNFYERHVLHSLSIAKVVNFANGTRIMDVGTGGGFPGIPLAILFPQAEFLLVDSIGKKIKVVQEIAGVVGLRNVKAIHCRAEQVPGTFDFVVSRAVTALPEFVRWSRGKINGRNHNPIENGILYLKGGDISVEVKDLKAKYRITDLSQFYEEEFFKTKKLVHLYDFQY